MSSAKSVDLLYISRKLVDFDGLGSIISRMGEIRGAIGKLDHFKFQGLTPLFPPLGGLLTLITTDISLTRILTDSHGFV